MRICSFLPSATEILYELDLGDSVVGVTHECDFPSDANNKTIVVRSAFDASKLSSEEIDNIIVQRVREGKDIYVVDDSALRKASPDLIVAQGLCEVCSPHMKELNRAMSILGNKPKVVVLDPHDLDEILVSIEQVAKTVGKERKGEEIVQKLWKRIDHVRSVTRNTKNSPKVLCIEWLDPLFTAGHWVPQMVEVAHAVNGISKRGEPSRRMEWKEALEFDPDIIVLMPCGFDIERTMRELWRIEKHEEWQKLPAVKNKMVYATDASSYFSRPGPRTVTGLEILAKIIHPDLFRDLNVPEDAFRRIY
ncbi:MAG: iron complex transport system substrate-binding protein [Candidatus Nitrosomirales archaeon]|jgi:iron complex transport system substrate-binding protein